MAIKHGHLNYNTAIHTLMLDICTSLAEPDFTHSIIYAETRKPQTLHSLTRFPEQISCHAVCLQCTCRGFSLLKGRGGVMCPFYLDILSIRGRHRRRKTDFPHQRTPSHTRSSGLLDRSRGQVVVQAGLRYEYKRPWTQRVSCWSCRKCQSV